MTFHNISNKISSLFSILSVPCFYKKGIESQQKSFLKTDSTHEQLCSSRAKGKKLEPRYKSDTFASNVETLIDEIKEIIAKLEAPEITQDDRLGLLRLSRTLVIHSSTNGSLLLLVSLRTAHANVRNFTQDLINLGYRNIREIEEHITQANDLYKKLLELSTNTVCPPSNGERDE